MAIGGLGSTVGGSTIGVGGGGGVGTRRESSYER